MRYSVLVLALLCPALFAQGNDIIFNQAPPDVDAALRARVNVFYQAHVDGKFRQAMQVVADDSQETFFAADKPKYKSFKITNIHYEDANFTKARVLVEVPWDLLTPLGRIDSVPRPMASLWRKENGEWFWYVVPYDPCQGIEAGRFGHMHRKDCVDGKPVEMSSAPSGLNPNTWVKPENLRQMVRASDEKVMLSSHVPTSVNVRFDSSFPGEVTLQPVVPDLPGLSVKLLTDKIESGKSTSMMIAYNPPAPQKNPDQVIKVLAQPTGQVYEIVVTFDLPPAELSSGIKTKPTTKEVHKNPEQ